MVDQVRDPFFEHLLELPGKLTWTLIMAMDAIVIVLVFGELIHPAWYLFPPMIGGWVIIFARAWLLARRDRR